MRASLASEPASIDCARCAATERGEYVHSADTVLAWLAATSSLLGAAPTRLAAALEARLAPLVPTDRLLARLEFVASARRQLQNYQLRLID